MEIDKTQRGFSIANFSDAHGNKCSIQKSSAALEDMIWLGIDNPKLCVFENESLGKYIETTMPKTFDVNARMHLTQKMVKELLPLLQKFAETGEL